eukprot:m51a1_g3489 hypothetical protein (353) ;mRNA; f:793261-794565
MSDFHPLAPLDADALEDEPIDKAFKGKRPDPPNRPPPDIPKTVAGLASLIRIGAYGQALGLAVQVLEGELDARERALAVAYKVAALAQLRMGEEAAAEIDALGDLDAVPGAPFALRVAKAQLACSKSKSLSALYSLLETTQRESARARAEGRAEDEARWAAREDYVHGALASRHLQAGDACSAITSLERLVARHPRDARLLARVGRVYLHAGCLAAAEAYFKEAERAIGPPEEAARNADVLADRAMVKLAREEFAPAIELFLAAGGPSPSAAQSNNVSVAMFYNGNLSHSLATMRETASRDPYAVDEALQSNLCCMYDFASDTAEAKKAELMSFLSRACPERWPSATAPPDT